jgi:UPF0271 protein
MKIDLNCDLGEVAGHDDAIMPYITSANIACGFHAGDANVMRSTVRLAKQHGVNIGAHPSWPDLQEFGRREMNLSAEETQALVLYQIGALAGIAKAEGAALTHVKPHGALYNQAARDRGLADAIVRAVISFSRELILVGLAGSRLCEAGHAAGIKVASEGFPDRAYNPDGTLMSRGIKGALIDSSNEVAGNALKLIKDGIRFGEKNVGVDTLCLHGDHPRAAENAKILRETLSKNGIEVVGLK